MAKVRTIAKYGMVNAGRLLLAATFIFSGYVKAVDPMGLQTKIDDYVLAMGLHDLMPSWLTLGMAVVLPVVELTIGACLLFAIMRRFISKLTLAFMLVMTLLTVWIFVADPVEDCGCFGDAVKLSNGETLTKNIILLVCAALVAWRPLLMPRFISLKLQWIVTNATAVATLGLAMWCLYDLPVHDFRPYHIGADIDKGRFEPEDNPPMADFFIETTDGEDLTDSITGRKGTTMILVSPHLEKADDTLFGEIEQLCDVAEEKGWLFICLTASGEKGIQRWRDLTGAEYPIYQTDDVVLRTMIRSNPGLIIVKDSRIVGKWSHNRLPRDLDKWKQ